MGTTIIKTLKKEQRLNNEVIIQITKSQVINFFRFLVVLALVIVNFIAIYIESSFMKELFISQGILLLIYFIKTTNFNSIKK